MHFPKRFFQLLLMISTAGFCWLAMMAVHEFGHVLHAWLSGGVVARVVLRPWEFSRTDLAANPHPLFVAWGGAVWGCLLPVSAWLLFRYAWKRHEFLAAWFAGFCLIVNGAYLAAGSCFGGTTDDGGAILHHGGSAWTLWAFGLPAVAAGLWLWNGQGPHFGLGSARGEVDRCTAWGITALFLAAFLTEITLSV